MDVPVKELAKLRAVTEGTSKGKNPSIEGSLDSLLQTLYQVKDKMETEPVTEDTLALIAQTVEAKKKEIDEKQKEIYNAIVRLGKTLDKTFTQPLPSYDPLFVADDAKASLDAIVAVHFLRTGQFSTAEMFIQESGVTIDAEIRSKFEELHRILTALRMQDIGPALEWCSKNRQFLQSKSSPLEFYLHRSQYIRLLLACKPPDYQPALFYANTVLRNFYTEHTAEFRRLLACVMYLPKQKLEYSPYADLASSTVHTDLESLFATEYCASLGMSHQVPLRVVGDIGAGGALARIEKARTVMKEKKSEWSQSDELPVRGLIEITLAPEHRYHSIFACPVSKEQSTEQNPPMMMVCGHVITKDSLQKLSKNNGRVKCPYCPAESVQTSALRIYF
ncbi:CTLH/CRA C-terminal to lish motif domain-containing protein [Pisolithus orientalis]|uniref:CTLH/CRA C-terminal to lish motif domain-containing protein n=1 Tax=Pisolithus orientalis TaxID=936130 RepID=UPI00222523EA|nr:CTLH/CRA C-terminal to lish motif domain-containing protein [Pisolithus orientalis]KAI6028355.1 CTLH/CRA C-terminal to lish motif domain-containing protein [Pisolithus orientalis]